MALTDEQARELAETRDCSWCGAKAGQPCVGYAGIFHQQRLSDVKP